MENSKRIARNTLMLYFRQIIIMLVSLYTVRVVLNVLGAEDYGLYNVVAGVVSALGFLSGAMATATQRYFSYDLGRNNSRDALRNTFCTVFEIYILLSLCVVLIAETVGIWFVLNKLTVPVARKRAVFWIYQSAVVSFIFVLITTPYMSLIIAHENMKIYAYVSIIEAVLKLAIVFLLRVIIFDKLILYGILLCCVSFIITFLYRWHCHKHYSESHIRFVWNAAFFKEMVSYSGWNLFGSMSDVVKNQGLNIILNIFFGPIVNAARGVAMQVSMAVNAFAQNFSLSVRPQIIKRYANDETDSLLNLVYVSSKGTFLLLYIFALPLMLEINEVLGLWLKTVPESTGFFTVLVLVETIITSISLPLMSLIQATGKIKWYQIIVGSLIIANLPISCVILKFIALPSLAFIVNIIIAVIALFLRLVLIKKEVVSLSVRCFLQKVILPVFLVSSLSFILPFAVICFMKESFVRLVIVIIVSMISVMIVTYFVGLTNDEKVFFIATLKEKLPWKK